MSILQKGQVLPWGDKQIHIEDVLGTGMTAEVYRAVVVSQDDERQEVALKYLRPGVGEDVEKLFFAEPENLQRVYQAWETAQHDEGMLGRFVRTFPFPAPRLWGESKNPPFIVMDLIQGKPLGEFLDSYRKEHETYIERWEPLILRLGVHLGTLLWVLHDHARRCYSDMKIGNFWWVGSEESPALLLTDWNVLNELGEEWIQRDLFLATLMLYTWLTGDVLPRQRLQITVPLGTLPAFRRLSRGVRQFLRRALSPTLNIRYASAEAWTMGLWEVLSWWEMEDDALMQTLEQDFATIREIEEQIKAQEEQGAPDRDLILAQAAAYQKFGNKLDIADLRGLAPDEYLDVQRDYEERLSPLGIGQRALQGLSFDLAMEQFERGASLFPDQAVAYRHWWTVADGAKHIPMEVFRQVREKVLQAVEKVNERRWREAKSLLDEASATILGIDVDAWQMLLESLAEGKRESGIGDNTGNGIVLLALEAQAVLLEQEAQNALQRGDYDRAEKLAIQARTLADMLPVDGQHLWYIQSNEIAALEDEIVHRKESAAKESELWGVIRNALENGAWERALEALRKAWDWLPEQRDDVLMAWMEAARKMWERGDVQALRVLVSRLAPLVQGALTETSAMKTQFVTLQGVLALLHQLATLREKNLAGVDWQKVVVWWQDALQQGRQLQWGTQPLFQEAQRWEQIALENGQWEGWYYLLDAWETVDWDTWRADVARLHQRADGYIRARLEGDLRTLEKLTAVLTERTPLLVEMAEEGLRVLKTSLQMAGEAENKDLQQRLDGISQRIREVKFVQKESEEAIQQRRVEAWKVVDRALRLGRPLPGEQPLGALVDAVGALRMLGETEIPAEYPNVTKYYQSFVAQDPQVEGNTPLQRLHNRLFYLWLSSTDMEMWQNWLALLKSQGKYSLRQWENVYWWASQLARHLPEGAEEMRRSLQQMQEEALDTLGFLQFLAERRVGAEQLATA